MGPASSNPRAAVISLFCLEKPPSGRAETSQSSLKASLLRGPETCVPKWERTNKIVGGLAHVSQDAGGARGLTRSLSPPGKRVGCPEKKRGPGNGQGILSGELAGITLKGTGKMLPANHGAWALDGETQKPRNESMLKCKSCSSKVSVRRTRDPSLGEALSLSGRHFPSCKAKGLLPG